MHFLPTGNKLLTTFLGKAAKIGVAKRPSRTLPVIQAIVLAKATEEINIEFGKRISEMLVSETLSSHRQHMQHMHQQPSQLRRFSVMRKCSTWNMQQRQEKTFKKCYCRQHCQKSNRCPCLPQQYLNDTRCIHLLGKELLWCNTSGGYPFKIKAIVRKLLY